MLSWREVVATYEQALRCPAVLNHVKVGEAIPGQPEWVGQMLSSFEMFDSVLELSELSRVFDLPTTCREQFITGNFTKGKALVTES